MLVHVANVHQDFAADLQRVRLQRSHLDHCQVRNFDCQLDKLSFDVDDVSGFLMITGLASKQTKYSFDGD
jgi:hypothetical protein